MLDTGYEHSLIQFMHLQSVQGKHHRFASSCHSVARASASAQAPIGLFIKNICLITDLGQCVVAIMRGADRASLSTIAKLLHVEHVRLASPEEVLTLTGYPAGGTPSFGYEAIFLMDSRVVDLPQVWTGGGSEFALVNTSPAAILAINQATVAKLRK